MPEALPPVIATLIANTEEFNKSLIEAKGQMDSFTADVSTKAAEADASLSSMGGATGLSGLQASAEGATTSMGTLGAAAEGAGGRVATAAESAAAGVGGIGIAATGASEDVAVAAGAASQSVSKVDDRARDASGRFVKMGDDSGKGLGNVSSHANLAAGHLGGLATAAKFAGAGIAAAGAYAVDSAMKYQTATTQLASSAGITVSAAQKITSAFLNTSAGTIYSGTAISQAYAGVASELQGVQGTALNAAQAQTVMTSAMDLAEASGNDLTSTTSSLGNVMLEWGLKSNQATAAANALFQTSRLSGTSLQQVGSSLTRMHTMLGAVTPPVGQLGALMVDLAQHGEAGRAAISGVSSAMQKLLGFGSAIINATSNQTQAFQQLSPAAQILAREYQSGSLTSAQLTKQTSAMGAQEAANVKVFISSTAAVQKADLAQRQLGITVTNSQGNFVGMASVITQLHDKIQGMNQAQQIAYLTQTLGAGSARKLLTVVEAGPAAYAKDQAAITAVNSAHAAAEKQAQTASRRFEAMKVTIEDLAIRFGNVLLPSISKLMPVLTQVLNAVAPVINMLGTVLVKAISAVLPTVLVLIKTGIEPLIKIFEPLIGVINKILPPLTQFANQILIQLMPIVQQLVSQALMPLLNALLPLLPSLIQLLEPIVRVAAVVLELTIKLLSIKPVLYAVGAAILYLTSPISLVVIAIVELYKHWDTIWKDIKTVIDDAWKFIKGHIDLIVGILTGPFGFAIAYVATHWKQVWDTIKTVAADVWAFIDGTVIQPIRHVFTVVIGDALNAMKSVWDSVWNGIKTTVQAVWNFIQPIFKSIEQGVHDITGGIGAVAHVASDITGGVTKVFEPWKWGDGGLVTRPTLGIVGDSGPELVLNPAQTKQALATGSIGVPSSSSIASSARGGSGVTIGNVTIAINSNRDPRQIAREIEQILLQWGRSNVSLLGRFAQGTT